jgi:hypothetical protein
MQYFKKFDFYGKRVSFFYGSSTYHRTIFGGLLSIFTFSLMSAITIYFLYNFLYQKPVINSNVIFFINKKFAELKGMEINGQLTLDIQEDMLNDYINVNNTYNQLDDFLKYYRIVLHEKYFEEIEKYHVAKIIRIDNSTFQFNVEMHISDVFKEKEFSSLKIISCDELFKKESSVIWPKLENLENENDLDEYDENNLEKKFEFDNSPQMCLTEHSKYFENIKKHNLENIDFIFSFDTPIYTVDRKGDLHKTQHLTRLNFNVRENLFLSYSMDINYVVIEDDSNIYYEKKKYDAYFTMKHPVLIHEDDTLIKNDYSLNIDLKNENNDQIILITIDKYKLLDFLAKLGGIMKIITIMKMTCTFWSSYFYEKTLYKLIVKRKNPYLEQKRLLLEPTLRNISSKKIMNPYNDKKFDPETSSVRSQASVNYNYTLNNYNSDIGPFALPDKMKKKDVNDEYCSYFAWVMNKFCKLIYSNKEARRKKLMITDTLGLSNYLLHLDYIDRQIILEQQTGEINNKIKELLARSSNNNYDDSKENMEMNLDSDKGRKMSETETNDNFDTKNKMKELVEEDDI